MKQNKNGLITNDTGKLNESETKINRETKKLLSPLDFLEYLSDLTFMISNNAEKFLQLPVDERIDILSKRIYYLEMIEAIIKKNVLAVLKVQLQFEIDCLERKRNSEKSTFHLLTPDEILLKMKFNKIPIHGKMIDLGHKIGFIICHLKNSNGHHYFDIETIIIARWMCALFVQSNGDPLLLKTMQEYIAEGKNMKLSDFIDGLF